MEYYRGGDDDFIAIPFRVFSRNIMVLINSFKFQILSTKESLKHSIQYM